MGPSVYFGVTGNNTAMGLATLAGGLAAVFLHLDKFKYFKAASFEAQLQDKIQEADITIQKIRELMKPLIIFTFHQITHSGSLGGRDQLRNLFEDICKLTEELDLGGDLEIQAKKYEHLRLLALEWYNKIYAPAPNSTLSQNHLDLRRELIDLFPPDKGWPCPKPDMIKNIFQKNKAPFTEAQKEALGHYASLLEKHPELLKK